MQALYRNAQLPGDAGGADIDFPSTVDAWVDAAIVKVPPKTKRKTVIADAIKQVPALVSRGPAELRVIPAEHAEPIKVEMEQPPPRLKIG